jgi:23S rRNA pseudouridine1911/1915/1917 synthase
MTIRILYQDNHLLIVDKPHGLVTQPSQEHVDSLEQRAKEYIKKTYNKPGLVFLHAVHRLDKDVAGIVIFAKTSKALERMHALLRNREVKKTYRAKVHGILKIKHGTWIDSLEKKDHKAFACENQGDGKLAKLSFCVVKEIDNYTFIDIDLETGRYHQIRVQLSHHGHPIIGDVKYGSNVCYPDCHIDLIHQKTQFVHPIKQTLLDLKSSFEFS